MIETDKGGCGARSILPECPKIDEVPIGACLVSSDGDMIASGFNRTIIDSDPTAHADSGPPPCGCKDRQLPADGNNALHDVEPCVMCAGALVNARVKRLVFGTADERFGAVETLFRLCDHESLNHRMDITSGVLAHECRALMQDFFRSRR